MAVLMLNSVLVEPTCDKIWQDFYFVRDLHGNLILSLEWLKQKMLEYTLTSKLMENHVNIQKDIYVASMVRMKRNCVIKSITTRVILK